jgi:hypothetical protein
MDFSFEDLERDIIVRHNSRKLLADIQHFNYMVHYNPRIEEKGHPKQGGPYTNMPSIT